MRAEPCRRALEVFQRASGHSATAAGRALEGMLWLWPASLSADRVYSQVSKRLDQLERHALGSLEVCIISVHSEPRGEKQQLAESGLNVLVPFSLRCNRRAPRVRSLVGALLIEKSHKIGDLTADGHV